MCHIFPRASSRRRAPAARLLALCLGAIAFTAAGADTGASGQGSGAELTFSAATPLDPEHARAVMQKARSGASLSADEQAYLERVKQMLQKQRAQRAGAGTPPAEPVARAQGTAAEPADWERLQDGSYGRELDYTGVGGISLPGYVRKPAGDGPFPAILYLHGGKAYARGKDTLARQGRTVAAPMGDFLKAGWVVYSIDYRPTDSPLVSVLDAREIDDSVAASVVLRQLPFVDRKRVGLVGCSHGAQLSTRLISRVALNGAVICAPACFELPETKLALAQGAKINAIVPRIIAAAEQKYGAPLEEIVKDPGRYGYASAFTELAAVKCPVLFINGKNDDNSLYTVVSRYAERLQAAGTHAETYFPDNGPHGFYSGHPDIPEYAESTRLTVAFFKEQFAGAGRVDGSNQGHLAGRVQPAAAVPGTTAFGDDTARLSPALATNNRQITNPKTVPYAGPPIVYRYAPHDTKWNTPREAMMAFVDPIAVSPPGTTYKTFHSKTIDGDVSYLVALPPGYDQDPSARYPVLYYLCASGATPKREAIGVQPYVDKAINSKAALPFIVVYAPGLCGNTMYCDSRDGRYPLETVITRDLIPHVDATYRTIPLREARGVEGFSMGGFGAAHLGFKFPDLFGVVSIKAPPLVEPNSKWRQVQQAWGNLFPSAMANDMEYFEANNPFTLVVRNAARLREHTYIRLTTHILTGENWIQARVEDLHQQLLRNNVAHEYHVYESVKTHNPTAVFECEGTIAFNFFNSLPAELRHGSASGPRIGSHQ